MYDYSSGLLRSSIKVEDKIHAVPEHSAMEVYAGSEFGTLAIGRKN
jgi:hypothetical protein